MQYVWQPDRIGTELNIDFFCLDIHFIINYVKIIIILLSQTNF